MIIVHGTGQFPTRGATAWEHGVRFFFVGRACGDSDCSVRVCVRDFRACACVRDRFHAMCCLTSCLWPLARALGC